VDRETGQVFKEREGNPMIIETVQKVKDPITGKEVE
jgi:hypothetical protein